jgi:hypothetical protein
MPRQEPDFHHSDGDGSKPILLQHYANAHRISGRIQPTIDGFAPSHFNG